MCGIAGVLKKDIISTEDHSRIRAAIDSLRHRGPDQEGFLQHGPNLLFGHARLSIIDISGGRQPMQDKDQILTVVFNGEIYNYVELREELVRLGHGFKTDSDTEVILESYKEWGGSCLEKFNGMFSFALWDSAKKSLFLARDPLGEKGLYYCFHKGSFMFASEPKALFKLGAPKKWDPECLSSYLAFRAVMAPQTPFKDIMKLDCGSCMAVDAGLSAAVRKYWTGLEEKRPISIGAKQAEEELISRLDESVRIRLRSDVPLGAFLSGGVDSSLVTALAARRLEPERVKTFSIAVKDWPMDESRWQELVSRRFKTEHTALYVQETDILGEIDKYCLIADDIVADPSAIALQCLARLVKERGVTVVLSGEGADELFAGYSSYRKFQVVSLLRSFGPLSHIWKMCPRLFSGIKIFSSAEFRSCFEEDYLFCGTASVFTRKDIRELSCGSTRDLPLEYWARKGAASLDSLLRFDAMHRIPGDLLTRTDRATMAYSLECRVPFLDPGFVSWAMNLDDAMKVRFNRGKYILKKAAEHFLPKELLYRKKIGFDLPVGKWLKGAFYDMLKKAVLIEKMVPGLNYKAAQEVLDKWDNGNGYLLHQVWRLFFLERWYRTWFST